MKAFPILRDTFVSSDFAFALPDGKFAPFFRRMVLEDSGMVYSMLADDVVSRLEYTDAPSEVVGILTAEGAQMFEDTQVLRVYVDADDEEDGCLIENPAEEDSWFPISVSVVADDWALSYELATQGMFGGGTVYTRGAFMGYLTAEGLQEVGE